MHDIAQAERSKFKMKSTRKSVLKAALGLGILVVVLLLIKGLQIFAMVSSGKKAAPPPVTVTSAVVKEENWAPILSAVGTVSAVEGAIVATELGGVVSEIDFESGASAKKGDILMKLDTSSEGAQLRTAEAELKLARQDLERTRDLATRRVISQAELDAGESKLKQKEGAVDNMRAMIAKKEVRAPFDGELGIRQVNVGQMINAGQQVVPITSLDPVYVDFSLPQQHLSQLSQGLEVRVQSDAVSGREFKGKLTAVNSMIDPVTRNVSVQATLDNPDHALRPGMFAKVEVMLPEEHPALVIPGSAVSYAPFGDSVFVIEKKKDEKTGKESEVIRQQFVRVGEPRGDFVSITSGLKTGESVVSTGVFKLRNGMTVAINNDLAPKPQLNPTPADS
jgi:membrane fusion protein, multidrug efflux system